MANHAQQQQKRKKQLNYRLQRFEELKQVRTRVDKELDKNVQIIRELVTPLIR